MDIKKKQKKLTEKEAQWEEEKPLLERENTLKQEKEKFKKSKTSTSKFLIVFLFVNCTIIEIFTGWSIIKMLSISLETGNSIDFSPLLALIGAVVGEVIGYAIYSLKAVKENTVGGIVYDMAMQQSNGPGDEF